MKEPCRPIFEDSFRRGTFKTDPEKWDKASREVVDNLKLILEHKGFTEVFETARIKRAVIAEELGHAQYAPKGSFGALRRRGDRTGDNYVLSPNSQGFISGEALFTNIVKIIRDQNLSFASVKQDIKHDEYDIKSLYQAKDSFGIIVYEKEGDKNGLRQITRVETVYVPLLYDSDKELQEIMSVWDELTKNVLDKNVNHDKALFLMGLFAYDFCRLCLLNRGTAAVARWILQALGELKFEHFKLSPIKEISFDIYSQIKQDRVQYAMDFAKNIKNDFVYLPEYNTLPIIEKIFLNRLLDMLIDKISKIPRGFSLNFFSQDKKEIVKQKLMAIKNNNWSDLNNALQEIVEQIESLQSVLSEPQKNEFKLIANNVKDVIVCSSQKNNSKFSFIEAIDQIKDFHLIANIVRFSDKAIYFHETIKKDLELLNDPKYKDLINKLKTLLYTPYENFLSALEELNKLYEKMIVVARDELTKQLLNTRKAELENLISVARTINPANLNKMCMIDIRTIQYRMPSI